MRCGTWMRPAGGSWLTKSEPCLGLAVALAERIATWYIVGSKERKKGRHKVAAGLSRAWKCGEVTKPECVAGGIIEGHISARVPCVARADMRIGCAQDKYCPVSALKRKAHRPRTPRAHRRPTATRHAYSRKSQNRTEIGWDRRWGGAVRRRAAASGPRASALALGVGVRLWPLRSAPVTRADRYRLTASRLT